MCKMCIPDISPAIFPVKSSRHMYDAVPVQEAGMVTSWWRKSTDLTPGVCSRVILFTRSQHSAICLLTTWNIMSTCFHWSFVRNTLFDDKPETQTLFSSFRSEMQLKCVHFNWYERRAFHCKNTETKFLFQAYHQVWFSLPKTTQRSGSFTVSPYWASFLLQSPIFQEPRNQI